MTESEKQRYIDFLRAKVRLFADRMDAGSASGFIQMNSFGIAHLERSTPEAVTRRWVADFDREIELSPREGMGAAVVNEVVAELKKQYGFGRLAEDPEVVIKRVMRRKKIANNRELRVILDVLACVDDRLDPAVREAIDAAARRYEGLDQWGPIKRIDT